MKNLLILVDYRGQFWLKSTHKEANFDLQLLRDAFAGLGYRVCIRNFCEIDFRNDDYHGHYILYQSSEDPNLLYKSYIEDILLGLSLKGAILVPPFEYLRAHHNKVFMEILRDIKGDEPMQLPRAWYFGTYEDFCRNKQLDPNHNYVFKLASGAQSRNVRLISNKWDFFSIPRRMSTSLSPYYWLVDKIKPHWKKRYPGYIRKSHHRNKFILQEFIEGLQGDYKVLVFPTKIFVLTREVRPNDFRASGSGRFTFVADIPVYILEYAHNIFELFDVPYISLDIADHNGNARLIEFQFVGFGTYTAERAPFYFSQTPEGEWLPNKSDVVLESEIAASVDYYISTRSELQQ